jgi:predicted phage terminase large subunit-like protein
MTIDPTTERYETLLKRMIALERAREELIPFTKLMMPFPSEPDDVDRSLYDAQKFHRIMGAALEEFEAGRIPRLIITLPPRHGKTQLVSIMLPAWFIGRQPSQHVIFGTYNETYSQDVGRSCRDVITSPAYAQVFPHTKLRDDTKSADRLRTIQGGQLIFSSKKGSLTGRGGHILVLDDLLKDRLEADSPTIREHLWNWFNQVVMTRLMDERGRALIVSTRWHMDDLVGRLTDPANDLYNQEEAKRWKIINLPALAEENDVLGRRKGEPLWPGRFGREYLLNLQKADARGFAALYQNRPTPEGGAFFKAEHIKTYRPNQLPKKLRYYVASDHAVSLLQGRDRTCIIPVGIDEHDDIWILQHVWWRQASTDTVVEAMLKTMRTQRPIFWWAEKSHISKSIGPFLRKRMLEEHTYCTIVEVTPIADKQTRAQSIQGRMAMGKVHFPELAPWWLQARDQILRFPHDAHDDFVDALAYIGLGLDQQAAPSRPKQRDPGLTPYTWGWLKEQRADHDRTHRISTQTAGW